MMKRIVILGSGESGTGAAMLAKKQGFEVFVSDKGLIPDNFKQELNTIGVPFEEGHHTAELILNADEIIKSPGIPDDNSLLIEARQKGIAIINELEFASRYTKAKIIGITGTNGKTTTTKLVYHLLKNAGLDVAVAGNIGISLARLLTERDYQYLVLEISSFQLDNMYNFKADIAVLCNITSDHLDRYQYNLQNYVDAKFRITQNQTDKDVFIYCAEDELTMNNISKHIINAKQIPFAYDKDLAIGAHVKNGQIISNISTENLNPFTMYINELALKGRHNAYNSMAAAIIGQVLNIRKE